MSPSPAPPDSPVSSPGASPSTLAGASASEGQSPASQSSQGGPDQGGDKGMQMVIQKIRSMETDLVGMAKQFPSAAPAFRKTVDNLRSALRQIVANPGSSEPDSPPITG